MGVNVVSNFVSSPVAAVSKPVVSQDSTTASSTNSQPVVSLRNDSADANVNTGDGKQDPTTITTRKHSESDLADVTEELNNFMESMNTNIKFTLHTRTNELMVQVEDNKTHRILKECPAHELLDMVARMRDYVGGLLDKKA